VLDALVTEARLRFGLDPAAGLQVIAIERLIATPFEASRPVLLVPLAMLRLGAPDPAATTEVLPLPGRHGPRGRTALDVLARAYPPDHAVGRFGTQDEQVVADLRDDDLMAPLYLRPVAPEAAVAGPWAMPAISARLRAPGGCPWDQEQTHASLRKHLLEEAYEVYDALEAGATPALAGELGDLLLQVVLHAQLAAEAGVFDLADVQAAIGTKIVRRHPHVFGDAEVRTASDVNRQWERIKADERAEAGAADRGDADGDGAAGPARGALDGISASLPALAASQEMQERAANLGYDWPSLDGVLDKVVEETDELRAAADDPDPAAWAEEFGDLLFVLVNVARKRGVEAEAAVRAANAKFRRRFGSVERQAADRGVALRDLDFAALDELWDAAKAEERITS
jgi:tetrapyrrole methylase family protein/MazG family protein